MVKNPRIHDQFMLLCSEGTLDRFWTTSGSMLAPFWGHLEFMFGVFAKLFGDFPDLADVAIHALYINTLNH